MRFSREYLLGGASKLADHDDWVCAYIGEDGTRIEKCGGLLRGSQWYEVDGNFFETLAMAKRFVNERGRI